MESRENWGIDLVGRPMVYAPWPLDEHGNYRAPRDEERAEVYAQSAWAIRETLVYFESLRGDTRELCDLLNRHVPDPVYACTREELLDGERFCTHEYYFYFIMFSKRVIGRYDFRFGEGTNERLSVYHQIYEKGFLDYHPYECRDISNEIASAFVDHIDKKAGEKADCISWIDSIARPHTSLSYEWDISPIRNAWISEELDLHINVFSKILLNRNDMFTIVFTLFDSYFLGALAIVPRGLLMRAITQLANQSSRKLYKIRIDQKKTTVRFMWDYAEERAGKSFDVYRSSICDINNNLAAGTYVRVIQRIYNLETAPTVEFPAGTQDYPCEFVISWKARRTLTMPLAIFLCASLLALALNAHQFSSPSIPWAIGVGLAALSGVVLLINALIRRNHGIANLEQRISDLQKVNIERVTSLEQAALALMSQKQSLEQKVRERTHELQEANERLRELDIAKTRFFANISHELRTPLTLILGPLSALMDLPVKAKVELDTTTLGLMHHNALRLLRLINSLLDLTRIDAGKLPIRPSRVDLVRMLSFFVSSVESAAQERGLELSFTSAVKSFAAATDPELLERIVLNLLSNALKFTPAGGSVRVSLKRDGPFARIEVKDSGIGIPEEKLESIFERFSQVDGSISRAFEGSGIGLALVAEISSMIGASVKVKSKVGVGTSFVVRMPVDLAASEPGHGIVSDGQDFSYELRPWLKAEIDSVSPSDFDEDRSPEDPSLPSAVEGDDSAGGGSDKVREGRPVILLVDDNPDMLRFLRSQLEDLYSVESARNGTLALRRVRSRPPDLIITDLMMPELDGFQMLREMHSDPRLRSIPVIILSARAEDAVRIEGLETGAEDYLAKPFSARELRARVRNHLQIQDLRKKVEEQNIELRHTLDLQLDRVLRSERLATLGTIASEVAHEINNPNHLISLTTGTLRKVFSALLSTLEELVPDTISTRGLVFDRSDVPRMLDDISEASTRIAAIASELKNQAKSDPASWQVCDARDIISQALRLNRHLIEAATTRLEISFPEDPIPVYCAALRLEQVVGNLLQNAAQALENPGQAIRIGLLREERDGQSLASVTIKDEGVGMSEKLLGRIGEAFFSTKRDQGGTGLGLMICRRIVSEHGGSLEFSSRPGEGTVAKITIPARGSEVE